MPRSLGRCMGTFFARGVTYWLALFVIMIRMTVAPIPICRLLLLFRLGKGTILFVSLAEVSTIGTVFVVIPIMVVLVGAVIDLVVIPIVSMVFFLASIVLQLGRSTNCHWRGKGCTKKKGTDKISITTMHIVFLLAQEFHLGSLAHNEYPLITLEAMFDTAHSLHSNSLRTSKNRDIC
jgi:hypothetical protein